MQIILRTWQTTSKQTCSCLIQKSPAGPHSSNQIKLISTYVNDAVSDRRHRRIRFNETDSAGKIFNVCEIARRHVTFPTTPLRRFYKTIRMGEIFPRDFIISLFKCGSNYNKRFVKNIATATANNKFLLHYVAAKAESSNSIMKWNFCYFLRYD
jgi:hypothetical protein